MLGIDVGTTRAKAFLIDRAGQIVTSAIAEYPMFTPRPLWGEQHPADWWVATVRSARHVLANTYVTILLTTGFFILSKALLRPAAFSLISKCTTVGQGVAMGLSSSFMSLGRIAGPIWAGCVFDAAVNYPYLSGSVIMFIGFLISLVWVTQGKTETISAGLQPAAD